LQVFESGGRRGLDRVGDRDDARGLPVEGKEKCGRAVCAEFVGSLREVGVRNWKRRPKTDPFSAVRN
jgi:hypothetical protein